MANTNDDITDTTRSKMTIITKSITSREKYITTFALYLIFFGSVSVMFD